MAGARPRSRGAVTAPACTGVTGLAIGLLVLLGSAASPRTLGGHPTGAPLAVHVAGDHLVDASGATLLLRGMDISGTEYACDQGGSPTSRGWGIYGNQPLDQAATYAAVAAWAVGVVRVPLNEDCWLAINGVNPAYAGQNYRAAIATEVTRIHAAGMVAILDLHWNAPGSYAAVAQQPMPDADHSVAFWSSVASAFRTDPAVIFDLYNEPYPEPGFTADPSQDDWACWLNGCAMATFVSANALDANGNPTGYTTTYAWQAAGVQQLISAVRQLGATQPVMANGLGWANDLSGWLAHRPSDPAAQLIAGWHSYPGQPCSIAACWSSVVATVARQVPVLIGETGDHVVAPVTYVDVLLPWADTHGIGYLGWTWNAWQGYIDNVLIVDWSGTPTPAYGRYFRDHLRALVAASTPTAAAASPTASAWAVPHALAPVPIAVPGASANNHPPYTLPAPAGVSPVVDVAESLAPPRPRSIAGLVPRPAPPAEVGGPASGAAADLVTMIAALTVPCLLAPAGMAWRARRRSRLGRP